MVRINLINPRALSDQHLIAEYNEILMLLAYIKKYPKIENIPSNYTLNKGHMTFFKDKIIYLKKRHELIKKEMKNRKFICRKTINLASFKKQNKYDWKANKKDFKIIKERIIQKLKLKPNYYRYYGKYKPVNFFINIIKSNNY